ncbi:MAG TPA: Gfo/Idh/MocA family oxidoreductase [Fimbriimonadaceae bacterium]|nr:Gfo/Idh/MocA family oxidoreductase [Fimbriimonadaceae bacterium]HRJ97066.1 Gfo/Idh/MocA family oxidoreductase [Fimbriimonadaceae bacterium]
MSTEDNKTSRRSFLQATGGLAAVTLLPRFAHPTVHNSADETIRVALVGCGGRGGGAAINALATKAQGPIKLVAMADAFADRLAGCHQNLTKAVPDQIDVPSDRQFLGFDAYKKAMDCLQPGDVVILTTPPAFRWVHFGYAIAKKLHVFMEKPVTVDGPTSKRMLALGEQASAAGLKVGVGLMSRHSVGMIELHDRIQNGELGEILLMRGYRMHGPAGYSESTPKPAEISHLEYQIRRFHSYLWASGGCYNDFYIHHIDHLCWMKNAWPVSAQGLGGRHYRQNAEGLPFVDQNFDTYAVEYTFADGTKMFFDGRCVTGAAGMYSSYVHGTKGMGIAAQSGDCGGPSATYKGQVIDPSNLLWESTDASNPYQNEWDKLIAAIRQGKPHDELKRGVEASLVSSMGRMAAHTGQEITFDAMLNCEHEFAPGLDSLTFESPAPLLPGPDGRYPTPKPGANPKREF